MTEHPDTDAVTDEPGRDEPPTACVPVELAEVDPVANPTPAEPTRDALVEAVDMLRAALGASIRTQEHQQLLLDKIHEEKEQLREAEHRRQRDPVLRDLIQLADTCTRTSRQWHGRDDVSRDAADAVSGVLMDAAADVRLILERQGVEEFRPSLAERFARTEAKAIGTRSTREPDRDGSVAEVRKPGYRLGDRVLRFSEVIVWRLEPVANADAQ